MKDKLQHLWHVIQFLLANALPAVGIWLAFGQEWPPRSFLQLGGWGLLGVFLPALIWISVTIKRDRTATRLAALAKAYDLEKDRYFTLYRDLGRNAFGPSHYFPVLVVSAFCFFFATLLVYTNQALEGEVPHFLTSGPTYQFANGAPPPSFTDHDVKTLAVMAYAYLGWYVWSVSTVFSRLITMEFVPGTLYGVMSRLALSIITACVAYQMLDWLGGDNWIKGQASVVVLGFLAGMFPSSLLNFIKQKVKALIQSREESEEIRVDVIEGISPWRMFRLYDTGLDDCENLAAANPIELWDITNLTLLEIIDWIGQAQLAVLFGEDLFIKLRKNGVRTSIDFYSLGIDQRFKALLVTLTGYEATQIEALLARMQRDPNFNRLAALRCRIARSDEREAQTAELAKAA